MSREYPARPFVGVGAVIWREEEVLMIRQEKYTALPNDFWTLPGGAQKLGETVLEALEREIKEETGLEVRVGPLVDIVDAIFPDGTGRIKYHYTLLDYRCEWVAGEARAGSDAKAVRWIPFTKIDSIKTWEKTRKLIQKSARMKSGG